MFLQINFMARVFARSSLISFGGSSKLLPSSKCAENKEQTKMTLKRVQQISKDNWMTSCFSHGGHDVIGVVARRAFLSLSYVNKAGVCTRII